MKFLLEEEHQDLADGLQALSRRSQLVRFKERFITTIESHGLDHLVTQTMSLKS
jgi:hypothetical protein